MSIPAIPAPETACSPSSKLDQGLDGRGPDGRRPTERNATTSIREPFRRASPASASRATTTLRFACSGIPTRQERGGRTSAASLIAPGTERVYGPEIPLSAAPQLLPYTRTTDTLNGEVSALQKQPSSTTAAFFAPVTGKRTYDSGSDPRVPLDAQAVAGHDAIAPTLATNADLQVDMRPHWAGLYGATVLERLAGNSRRASSPDANQRELRVSYLWQNNYARDTAGAPDQRRRYSRSDLGDDFKPEADVRQGGLPDALVAQYSGRRAGLRRQRSRCRQTIQFSDKVKIGNATR